MHPRKQGASSSSPRIDHTFRAATPDSAAHDSAALDSAATGALTTDASVSDTVVSGTAPASGAVAEGAASDGATGAPAEPAAPDTASGSTSGTAANMSPRSRRASSLGTPPPPPLIFDPFAVTSEREPEPLTPGTFYVDTATSADGATRVTGSASKQPTKVPPTTKVKGFFQRVKQAWNSIPRWLSSFVVLIIVVVVLFVLYQQTSFLKEAFAAIRTANYWWVAACTAASFASMLSFAAVQWTLLRAAGVRSPFWKNTAIVFASNALSGSIPGGPVLGTALTFRETRRLGASTIVATWQLVVAGVLATAGLTILGLGGVVFVGTTSNPYLLTAALIALVAVLFVLQWAMRNPQHIEGRLRPVVQWVQQKRRKDPEPALDKLHSTIEQMKAVELSHLELLKAFGWSLFNWVADVACMGCAAYAVGARPSVGGMAIAYVSGKIIGTAPVTPGGFGTVDGTLIWALTLGGLTAANSLATVLVYRLISFALMVLIGWLLVLVLFRGSEKTSALVSGYAETAEELGYENATTLTGSIRARHRVVQEKFDKERRDHAAAQQAADERAASQQAAAEKAMEEKPAPPKTARGKPGFGKPVLSKPVFRKAGSKNTAAEPKQATPDLSQQAEPQQDAPQ